MKQNFIKKKKITLAGAYLLGGVPTNTGERHHQRGMNVSIQCK